MRVWVVLALCLGLASCSMMKRSVSVESASSFVGSVVADSSGAIGDFYVDAQRDSSFFFKVEKSVVFDTDKVSESGVAPVREVKWVFWNGGRVNIRDLVTSGFSVSSFSRRDSISGNSSYKSEESQVREKKGVSIWWWCLCSACAAWIVGIFLIVGWKRYFLPLLFKFRL